MHLVDERNRDLRFSNLLGVAKEKYFMPSVANVVDTDLSTYKVIRKGRFACNLMHVNRDEVLPVALYKDEEPSIISPAYPMFEVNSLDELLPEYLNMYLTRKEFDREVVFYAMNGVRGSLDWDDFIAMKMPVPDIDEQRRIVAEYKAVEQKIENNNRLIKALEDTAQAIYYHTFVENIDKDNLPDGWQIGVLSDIAVERKRHITKSEASEYKYYLPIECIPKKCMVYGEPLSSDLAESSLISFDKKDIMIGAIRPYFHKVVFARTRGVTRSTCIVIRPNNDSFWEYLMCLIFQDFTIQYATAHSQGTTMPYVSWDVLGKMKICIPSEETCLEFKKKTEAIFNYLSNLSEEQIVLLHTLPLLLSKLS